MSSKVYFAVIFIHSPSKMEFRNVHYHNDYENGIQILCELHKYTRKAKPKKNKDKTVNLKNFRDCLISSHNVLRDLFKFKCVSTKQNRP